MNPIRITIWNEFLHERTHRVVMEIYPCGIHRALAEGLGKYSGLAIRTATLGEPEHGLAAETLEHTDVLTWWGHAAHDAVSDEIVNRIHKRV